VIICKRCDGYVSTVYKDCSDYDPFCINCGCTYPELNTSMNNTKKQKRKGWRDTIRYTGNTLNMKGQLGYITYTQHPNKGSLYPKLIVECPMCTRETESINASTNPYALYNGVQLEFVNGYRIAKQFIKCPTGHLFRLKVNEQGIYSWE